MKDWTEQSHLSGYFECPELFELPVDDSGGQTRWVTFAADGRYVTGSFDGRTFRPDQEHKHQLHYGNFYASQTFDNAPDGRRIQIGWMRVGMKGMPFNQAFSFPHHLTLRTTPDGIRMFAAPVDEIRTLRNKEHSVNNTALSPDQSAKIPVSGQLFDVEATFELGTARSVGLDLGGNRIVYRIGEQTWQDAATAPTEGRVNVRVLLDRSQLEVWGNNGAVVISDERRVHGDIANITVFAEGGTAKLIQLKAYELTSAWKQ